MPRFCVIYRDMLFPAGEVILLHPPPQPENSELLLIYYIHSHRLEASSIVVMVTMLDTLSSVCQVRGCFKMFPESV